MSKERKVVEWEHKQSSSDSPANPDDDFRVNSLDSKPNPFLPEETRILLDRIRRRLRERSWNLFEPYEKHVQNDDFLSSAIELIGARGGEQIVNPIAYFTVALVEILLGADGPEPETFDDDFGWLVQRAKKKRELREKHLGRLGPLTAEQDQARRQFNHLMERKIQ